MRPLSLRTHEMDHHLVGEKPGNRRNGYGKKTVVTDSFTVLNPKLRQGA